jgi:hypothetical protein
MSHECGVLNRCLCCLFGVSEEFLGIFDEFVDDVTVMYLGARVAVVQLPTHFFPGFDGRCI